MYQNHTVKRILIEEIRLLRSDTPEEINWSCPVHYTVDNDLWLVRVVICPQVSELACDPYIARYRFGPDEAGFWTAEPTFYTFRKLGEDVNFFPFPFVTAIKEWRLKLQSTTKPRKRSSDL